jgi:Uncharacterised nucleotidyltransferase
MPSLAIAPSLEGEVPPETAAFFRRALRVLVDAEVPFLVGGAFAHACFTGIRRATKDLDLFIRREDYDRLAPLMEAEGWRAELSYPHWLAKVYAGKDFIDLIFNSGNGISPVDERWFRNNAEAEVLGVPVRIANLEDSLVSKAFIMERERYDGADVAHILRASAPQLDWTRLLRRFGPHWRVLFNHLVMFGFIYPGDRQSIPAWVMRALTRRLERELSAPPPAVRTCQGTLISRAQYLVAIECWGYEDARLGDDGTMSEEDAALWTAAIATDAAASDAAPAAATIPTATATPRAS